MALAANQTIPRPFPKKLIDPADSTWASSSIRNASRSDEHRPFGKHSGDPRSLLLRNLALHRSWRASLTNGVERILEGLDQAGLNIAAEIGQRHVVA
jgi:hypothetical protein